MNLSEFVKKHNIISIIFQLAAFAVLFIISKTLLDDLYLFGWTAKNYYCFVWVIACLFSFFGKNIIGISVTAGAVLGVLAAQPVGDYIRTVNMRKITEDTDPQQEAFLSGNPGWYIWLLIILTAFIAGVLITVIQKTKNGKGKDISEYLKKHYIINTAVHIVVFVLFTIVFFNMGLFDFMSVLYYFLTLPISCLCSFFGKNEIGAAIVIGAVFGIPLSRLFYNIMQMLNISTDQAIIWILLLFASCLIGVVITVVKNKKRK